MRIVNLKELCKMPNGTVFAEYTPDILCSGIMIMTGHDEKNNTFNGVLNVLPSWEEDSDDTNLKYTNWSTWDCSYADYKDSDLFTIFDINEIQMMINSLVFALSGCKTDIDMDNYYGGKYKIHENEIDEYI